MGILIVLVPVTLVLAAVAVGAYLWAHRNQQFDDLDTPAYRVLFDDEAKERNERHES